MNLGLQPQKIVFELTVVEALLDGSELVELVAELQEQEFRVAVGNLFAKVGFDHSLMAFIQT